MPGVIRSAETYVLTRPVDVQAESVTRRLAKLVPGSVGAFDQVPDPPRTLLNNNSVTDGSP